MPTARLTGRSPAISWREQQRVGPKVIYEAVKVTKKFLDEHPEEAAKVKVPLDAAEKKRSKKASLIAGFLGWGTWRIDGALERLRLIDEGVLDKESVESMPFDNNARELFDGDYKRICVSMGTERKVKGSYTIATPVSSRCPSPHTRRA